MDTIQRTVYLETTIPSFYFEQRSEPEMVSRRNWTKQWWDNYRGEYSLFISQAVISELLNGDYPNREEVVNLVYDITVLEINHDIEEVVEVYLKNHLMPQNDLGVTRGARYRDKL